MDNLIEFAKEQCEIFPEDSYMGEYLRETIKMLQSEPCEMTTEEYRQRMMQAFQNANCEELIALCVLPAEKEFEHLEWLLKNHYKKETCEDAVSRANLLKKFEDRFIELQKAHQKEKQLGVNWCINTLKDMQPVKPTQNWISVNERLPKPFTFVNATCRSLVDDRENWVVETLYLPIPKENNEQGYSDWGNIPMLNWHKAEVIAWMERKIPKPYMEKLD